MGINTMKCKIDSQIFEKLEKMNMHGYMLEIINKISFQLCKKYEFVWKCFMAFPAKPENVSNN